MPKIAMIVGGVLALCVGLVAMAVVLINRRGSGKAYVIIIPDNVTE